MHGNYKESAWKVFNPPPPPPSVAISDRSALPVYVFCIFSNCGPPFLPVMCAKNGCTSHCVGLRFNLLARCGKCIAERSLWRGIFDVRYGFAVPLEFSPVCSPGSSISTYWKSSKLQAISSVKKILICMEMSLFVVTSIMMIMAY